MGRKPFGLKQKLKNLIQKLYPGRSILLVLLFLFSSAIPLLVAQVSLSTPIVQNQPNTLQLVEQGRKLYQARQFEEGVTVWQQATDAFAAEGDRLNQAMALSNLSLTYQQLGQWNQARNAIAKSKSLLSTESTTTVQQRILASTLDIEGQLQLSLGQPAKALKTWQQATNIYEKIGDRNGLIQSQINQAQAMQELGFYPRACTTLLSALGLESQNCQISEAELQLLPEPSSISLQILGLRSLGNVLRVTGQTKQSQMVLLKSWQLAQTREDAENLAEIALSLGNTARVLGNQKIEQKQSSVESIHSGTCVLSENYQTSREFYQQAIACYHQAELATSSLTKIQAQLNLLNLSIQRSQWSEVPTLVDKIQSQLTDLPSSSKTISAQLKLAQSLICLQSQLISDRHQLVSPILQSCPLVQKTAKSINPEELQGLQITSWQAIEQLVETALNQAQSLGNKQAEANALGYLGAISQLMGNPDQAQHLTEQALQQLSAFEHPELAYLWQWQLGRLYQLQGNPQQAIAAYTSSVNILESLRRDLVVTSSDIQFNFRDSIEPVYRELVDRLLQPSPNQQGKPGAIGQDSLKKARNIIESLQLAELNNFFREACIDAQPQQIDQIDPQAAVIYSIILPERLAVILSRPGKPLSYYETAFARSSSDSASEEIEQVFDEMFANLNPSISSLEPLRPHQQFYDWLIRPLEAELAESGIKTLVFVLDGVLRSIPMAALHDGRQYLIEKYNIALTPGLQLLSPRSLAPEQLTTLAGGLASARQGFSPLPGVKQEIQEITKIVSSEVILDRDFTRPRLQKEIEAASFPIVHLATHGQFSSQADDTFLLTWDERINVKNLDQLLKEREGQERSPIELLILSACQTAAGATINLIKTASPYQLYVSDDILSVREATSGNCNTINLCYKGSQPRSWQGLAVLNRFSFGDKRAVLGLAGVAVRSGARSTLATLWAVQDRSTADLMVRFYEALNQPGVSKAEALRQAQLSLLRSPQYQHPFYWAPFVLVGNWL